MLFVVIFSIGEWWMPGIDVGTVGVPNNNKSLIPLGKVGYMGHFMTFSSVKDKIFRDIIFHEVSLISFSQCHSWSLISCISTLLSYILTYLRYYYTISTTHGKLLLSNCINCNMRYEMIFISNLSFMLCSVQEDNQVV